MKPKISLITLGVKDFHTSLLFYRDGMGLQTHNYTEGDAIVFFEMEGTWLALYPKDELAADATVSPDGSGFSGFTLAHNVGSKSDVNTLYSALLHAGAKTMKKPADTSWGGYSGYIADPDGYLWEIAYNPFTDLT